jgi:hypothetical protein
MAAAMAPMGIVHPRSVALHPAPSCYGPRTASFTTGFTRLSGLPTAFAQLGLERAKNGSETAKKRLWNGFETAGHSQSLYICLVILYRSTHGCVIMTSWNPYGEYFLGLDNIPGGRSRARRWARWYKGCIPTGMHGPTCIFWADLTSCFFARPRRLSRASRTPCSSRSSGGSAATGDTAILLYQP